MTTIPTPTQQHADAVKAARSDKDDGLHFIGVPGGGSIAPLVIATALAWVVIILALLWLLGVL